MGVASGCGEQEVGVASGVGEISGCGCKEIYRFPHTTYRYSSCICSFLQQHPYFLFIFLNVFRSLLHCTVVITLGNLSSFPSYSCLVYNIMIQ